MEQKFIIVGTKVLAALSDAEAVKRSESLLSSRLCGVVMYAKNGPLARDLKIKRPNDWRESNLDCRSCDDLQPPQVQPTPRVLAAENSCGRPW